ncbi:Imm50 family immunity protein [Streptomyces sp. NBC_01766]|uniref:Imm50 family immunity protein n=1 Tax=Streptomyces sp. NBC_01766 TaxID=2975936 RepID=UPI002DD80454|nr:Imm50 family immunity protein [Streptomyces sp. NBC_01766]WSC20597.1 immunity 50 family protein [Streptomyces sp. NBC_01766]
MGDTDWTAFLSNPRDVLDLYEEPPLLGGCDLFYLHIDERDTSITFGFETRELPAHPRQEWKEKPFNSIDFFISFAGVSQLHIDGWVNPGQKEIDISRNADGGFAVRVASDGSDLDFLAESISLTHFHPFLAATESCC